VKKALAVILLVVVALGIAGCAPGPNSLVNTNSEKGFVPGFWYGLWNGIISPVTFIISLFNSKVEIYEVHNNGDWYNFGFMLGISAIFGGGGGRVARRRRDR
jgi:ABC-type multidrug transport system permease subunit